MTSGVVCVSGIYRLINLLPAFANFIQVTYYMPYYFLSPLLTNQSEALKIMKLVSLQRRFLAEMPIKSLVLTNKKRKMFAKRDCLG